MSSVHPSQLTKNGIEDLASWRTTGRQWRTRSRGGAVMGGVGGIGRTSAKNMHFLWSDFDDPWRALALAMKMVVLPLSAAASWCCELEGQIGVGGL